MVVELSDMTHTSSIPYVATEVAGKHQRVLQGWLMFFSDRGERMFNKAEEMLGALASENGRDLEYVIDEIDNILADLQGTWKLFTTVYPRPIEKAAGYSHMVNQYNTVWQSLMNVYADLPGNVRQVIGRVGMSKE